MILAVDMGNTNIVIGCADREKIYFEERIATDLSKTELEYYVLFKTVLDLYHIDADKIEGAIVSSVVPGLTGIIRSALEKISGLQPYVLGEDVETGLEIEMDQPSRLGSDLVVDAVAALEEYGAPLIVIDIGTATTMSVIDRDRKYIGGCIIPGVRVSSDALAAKASQLFKVSLQAPEHAIGKNTADCMNSGILYGHASCLDGMIARMEEELGYPCQVVATGGLAGDIIKHCKREILLDSHLLLKGLRMIYDRQKKGEDRC